MEVTEDFPKEASPGQRGKEGSARDRNDPGTTVLHLGFLLSPRLVPHPLISLQAAASVSALVSEGGMWVGCSRPPLPWMGVSPPQHGSCFILSAGPTGGLPLLHQLMPLLAGMAAWRIGRGLQLLGGGCQQGGGAKPAQPDLGGGH